MSQAPLENVNITETNIGLGAGGGGHQYPPQSAPTQAPQGMSNFVDGSGPIFSMYLEMAAEEDKKMVEGWKADADGILIFTGLFSAAVASLISVSIQDIRPNPQDTSNFYLVNIYQTLADPNRSIISSSLPASPPPFNAPNSSVWVNALWFLSLVISLTCALLATLLQQWARRYLKVTQPRYSPHKRARIRAFFFEGVDKLLLPWAVEALPTLLHVSLFLFFTGLVVFLCNVNLTIFKLVLSWVGACTAMYGCITIMPIFRHDSPYHTPLSLPAWHIVAGISFVIFWVLRRFTSYTLICFRRFCFRHISLSYFAAKAFFCFRALELSNRQILIQGTQRTVEESALNSPSDIDARAFLWTLSTLDEDHELERFFSNLPGFRSSKVVKDPLTSLTEEQREKLSMALMGLLDVTFSSDLLPESVKDRRAMTCAKIFDPALIPRAFDVFDKILSRYQYSGPMTTEIVRIMSGWGNNRENTNLVTAVCMTIARVLRRDDCWFILASDELGVPESVLRDYAAQGDSLSLAILIHITRQQFIHFWKGFWPWPKFDKVLEAASKFNVQDTSPKLQHEFCALWNQIVLGVKNDQDRFMALHTLGPIRHIYIALHQGTNAAPTRFSASTGDWNDIPWEPSSYPVCNVASHIHDDSSSTTTVLRDNAALIPASPTSPEVPSSSVPAPLHVVENLTDVPPLDNFHSAHQTPIQNLRIPVTPPGSATTGAIRDIITSGIIMPHPTTETSAFAPPFSFVSAAVSPHHNLDPLTPSNPPILPSSTSSRPDLDDILSRESHRSIVVTTVPSTCPGPTSASDLDSAVEDHGSPKPEFHKEEDAFNPHSVNWEIHANSITTRAIVGPSLREPNAARTGDSPVDPSHSRYDIV